MGVIRLFGIPKILDDVGSRVSFRSSKAIEVIVFVALNPQPVPRAAVASALWVGLPADRQLHNLRQNLLYIKQSFPEALSKSGQTLELGNHLVDFETFQHSVEVEDFQTALETARGVLLEGFEASWIIPFRERVAQSLLQIYLKLAEDRLQDCPVQAESFSLEAIKLDPVLESPRKMLIRALVAQGKQAKATKSYREYATKLESDFGVRPTAELASMLGGPTASADEPNSTQLKRTLSPEQYLELASANSRFLYCRGDLLQSRLVLEEALRVPGIPSHSRSMALARLQRILFDLGDVPASRRVAEEAQDLALYPPAKAASQLALARLEYASRNYEKCDLFVRAALKEALKTDILELQADIYNLGAVLRWFQHRTKDSLRLALRSERLAEQANAQFTLMVAKTITAAAFYKLGQDEDASAKYEEAIAVGMDFGFRLRTADALAALGRVRLAQDRIGEAKRLYQQSLDQLENTDAIVFIAHSCMYMGELELRLNNPERALPFIKRATALSRLLGNRTGIATGLKNAGKAYLLLNQLETAQSTLREAQASFFATADLYGQATCMVPLAQVSGRLGDVRQGLQFLDGAETILASIRPDEIAESYEDQALRKEQLALLRREIISGIG